jgi:hypothetical protein
MRISRTVSTLLFAAVALAACSGPSREELEIANAVTADSLSNLRNELLEQVMEGTRFVNEINKELAKARQVAPNARQLQPAAEMADVTEERRQIVARIAQLVTRLDQVQGRLAAARTQLAEKDSTLSSQIAAYQLLVTEVNQAAERQRTEFQTAIEGQAVRISSLSKEVDTLTGALGQLTADHNAVYYVAGTRADLIKKGVLVPEGGKRFLLVGSKPVALARELDPSVFTKIDRRSDTTIVLPDGVYKIVSRQNGSYVIPQVVKDGKIGGAFTIEQPERFWSTSRFLILVRS